ncbi:nucleotidyltransferase domain-containing protein, partial [Bacteroidota bacterium]
MSKREHIILQIKQIADKNYPNSEIILYGSRARGDAKPNSDWDILILLNQDKISIDTETKII